MSREITATVPFSSFDSNYYMVRLLFSIITLLLSSCGSDSITTLNLCGYEDGTYSATVEYYNPDTDYSNTYSLDVKVEGCEVVQINFPKGGWLDSDHITPAVLEDGKCTIEDENGRTYEVELD